MKLLNLLLIFFLADSSVGQSISCTYTDNPYTCNLSIQNPQGSEFDSVPGQHLPGRSDGDVEFVQAISQNTLNIPKIICFQFQNATRFMIVRSQVSVLTQSSFAYCEQLERLELYNNLIAEIPDNVFYAARNLRVLDINTNRLSSLSDNSFTGSALETIDFNFNQFVDFNGNWLESVNGTLTSLSLMQNRIETLVSGTFNNLRNLRWLNIGTNFIVELPDDIFLSLTSIEVLFLHGNRIINLRPSWFNQLTSLEELRLEFNLIGTLPARIFANNNRLRDLGLSFNQLTTIDRNSFGTLERLTTLYAEINMINAIDPDFFDAATSLNSFYLYDNICIRRSLLNIAENRASIREELQSCFNNFASTSTIHCSFISTAGFPYTCELALENPTMRDDFERIEGEHVEGNSDTDVLRVEGYWQFSPNIPSIICTQFTALEELVLSSSKIEVFTNYAIENCVNLRLLNLENNNITAIPSFAFGQNPNLQILDFFNNHIETIGSSPFSGTNLWYLNLEANDLWNLEWEWFVPIRETLLYLNLAANELWILDNHVFADLANLVELEVGFNNFWAIEPSAFANLRNLSYLSMPNCSLTSLNPAWFSDLSSLTILHLERNLLNEFPVDTFSSLTSLLDLYIYQNNITTIEASSFGASLSTLRNLNAQFNRINEIEGNFFERAQNLNVLYLFGNICLSVNLVNVANTRDQVRQILGTCFRNFGFLECNYIDAGPYGYFCELSITNIAGRNFERIEGNHLTERNDEDVFRVEAMEQETRNVPGVICSQFVNLRELLFEESDVEILTAEDLADCRNLELFLMPINRIQRLPAGLFGNSPNLQVANFFWNQISEISESAFTGTQIWDVELELNQLTTFNPGWFEPINETLLLISVMENQITSIPGMAFVNLRNVVELELGYNPLRNLAPSVFQGLHLLQDLGLEHCELNNLDVNWFFDLQELRRLHIQDNHLRSLPDGLLMRNPQLFELNVASNQLQLIQSEFFGNLSNIVTIFAYNNRMLAVDPDVFDRAERLNVLYMGNNVCSNSNFYNVVNNRETVRSQLEACFTEFALERTLSCSYSNDPIFNYACDATIRNIRGFDDFDSIGGNHLENRGDADVEFLFVYQQNSGNVPEVFCSRFRNLKQISITRSNVHELTTRAFANCTLLEYVNLENNQIWHIPNFLFNVNHNLEILNFANNQIWIIDPLAFGIINLKQLSLQRNWIRTFHPAVFAAAFDTLTYLNLAENRLQTLPDFSFNNLAVLEELNLNRNHELEIPSDAFKNISTLQILRLEGCGLSNLNTEWFTDLQALRRIYLGENSLNELPIGIFSALTSLTNIYVQSNSIQLVTSDWFGDNLAALDVFSALNNQINFIDPEFFEGAEALRNLFLVGNECASFNAQNVQANRDIVRGNLQGCFDNFVNSAPADVSCDYQYDWPYTCYLTLNNRHARNNFERIDGQHQAGRNDDDVILIDAREQISPVVPEVLCRQFRNLNYVQIINSGIRTLNEGSFGECRNLITLILDRNMITEVPDGTLNSARFMQFSAVANRIERIGARVFENTQTLLVDLEQNLITELEPKIFQPIAETLLYLLVQNNRLTSIPEGIFNNLINLYYLELSNNPFTELSENAFNDLRALEFVGLDATGLTSLPGGLFANNINVWEINMRNNQINELPENIFANLINLEYLFMDYLNLSTLNSTSFGASLNSLLILRARSNRINAIDPLIIDNASRLDQLYLLNNFCTDMNFQDVQQNIEEVRGDLWRCFANFEN